LKNILIVENVSKTIGKKTIINNLSFNVKEGEIVGFLGPNGSGKTTTIRMIVGLIKMSSGNIFINNSSIKDNYTEAVSQVGAIVETPEMYKNLSGYNNLLHFARMGDFVPKDRIDRIVKLVKLENRIHDKVKTYSLGMKQRLGIAQALLQKPSLLILDEPTNGLDPSGIREIRQYLRKIAREENIGILVSSHLLSEIELMCDSVVIIQSGEKISEYSISNEQVHEDKIDMLIEVDCVEKALAVLKAGESKKGENNSIIISMTKDMTAQVVETLVKNNINVYRVSPIVESLEDKFIKLTGGDKVG